MKAAAFFSVADWGEKLQKSSWGGEDTDTIRWYRSREPIKPLGKRASTHVYEALVEGSGKLLIVKEVMSHLDSDEHEVLTEKMRDLGRLNHPNVVSYFALSTKPDKVAMLMELCMGGSVLSIVRNFGALEDSMTRKFTSQIVAGLDYLHEHRVVCQLRLSNCMLAADGVVKLSDVGVLSRAGTASWCYGMHTAPHDDSLQKDVNALAGCVSQMFGGSGELLPAQASSDARAFVDECLLSPRFRPTAAQLRRHSFVRTSYPPKLVQADMEAMNRNEANPSTASSAATTRAYAMHSGVAGGVLEDIISPAPSFASSVPNSMPDGAHDGDGNPSLGSHGNHSLGSISNRSTWSSTTGTGAGVVRSSNRDIASTRDPSNVREWVVSGGRRQLSRQNSNLGQVVASHAVESALERLLSSDTSHTSASRQNPWLFSWPPPGPQRASRKGLARVYDFVFGHCPEELVQSYGLHEELRDAALEASFVRMQKVRGIRALKSCWYWFIAAAVCVVVHKLTIAYLSWPNLLPLAHVVFICLVLAVLYNMSHKRSMSDEERFDRLYMFCQCAAPIGAIFSWREPELVQLLRLTVFYFGGAYLTISARAMMQLLGIYMAIKMIKVGCEIARLEDNYGGGWGFIHRQATSVFVTVVGSYISLLVAVKFHREERIMYYLQRKLDRPENSGASR